MPGFASFPASPGVAPWRWRLHFVVSALVISVLLPFTFFMASVMIREQYLPYAESKASQNWQATQVYIVEPLGEFRDETGMPIKDAIETIKSPKGNARRTEMFYNPANPQSATLRRK